MQSAKIVAMNAAFIFLLGLIGACGGGGGSGSSDVGTPVPAKPLGITPVTVPDNHIDIDPREFFVFTLSSPLAASGLSNDQVELSDGSKTYPVRIEFTGQALTIRPVSHLHTSTHYRLTIKAGVAGMDGSVLQSDYVFRFRTVLAVFETRQLTPNDIGINSPRMIIADVNGDGRPDLVELSDLYRPDLFGANGYTLTTFLQNATGGFESLQKMEVVADQKGYTKDFSNLVALDLDGDNKPELLVPEFRGGEGETDNGIRVFKIGADGKFAQHDFITTNYTEKLHPLDVDGDGKTDLVGSNGQAIDNVTGGFQILLRTSTGFAKLAPVELQYAAYEFGSADLDEDGKPELLINRVFTKPDIGPYTNELLIYTQSAAGIFSKNVVLTNEAIGFCTNADYCRDMRITDLNGDGKPDLVFGAAPPVDPRTERLMLAFTRQAGGGLSKIFQISLGDSQVFAIKDMNNDGVSDLLATGGSLSIPYYTIIGGGPTLQYSNLIPLPVRSNFNWSNTVVADIDRDGLPDIVFDSEHYGIVMARQVRY